MIYTLTLNPSLDYWVEVDDFEVGKLHRTTQESVSPGGKGINVSQVLQRFQVENKALGFTGGFTGEFIRKVLQSLGVLTDFIEVPGHTRINVKIKSSMETELNAQGPQISEADVTLLKQKISALTSKDLLVLSGSIPSSIPASIYDELVQLCVQSSTRFVVDAEGDLLFPLLSHKPFLIKPNHYELAMMFHTKFRSVDDAIPYGQQLVRTGAQHVLVSFGEWGAVLITDQAIWLGNAPQGQLISSVGAGDSMVAGFISIYEKTNQVEEAFRFSIAAGSATAFSHGLCTPELVENLCKQVNITKRDW